MNPCYGSVCAGPVGAGDGDGAHVGDAAPRGTDPGDNREI